MAAFVRVLCAVRGIVIRRRCPLRAAGTVLFPSLSLSAFLWLLAPLRIAPLLCPVCVFFVVAHSRSANRPPSSLPQFVLPTILSLLVPNFFCPPCLPMSTRHECGTTDTDYVVLLLHTWVYMWLKDLPYTATVVTAHIFLIGPIGQFSISFSPFPP